MCKKRLLNKSLARRKEITIWKKFEKEKWMFYIDCGECGFGIFSLFLFPIINEAFSAANLGIGE